jgi:hypothetical protein
MAKTKAEIVAEIASYVRDCGGAFNRWYVGIASDAEDRLFNAHAVRKNGDFWIYRLCPSAAVAREIEELFISNGMDGASGDGDSSTMYVYAYRKTPSTRE